MQKQKKKSKRRRSRKKIYARIRKAAPVILGIAVLLVCMIFLFRAAGYKYQWENYGKPIVTEEFLDKVSDISDQLDTDPDYLMAVMAFESQLDHTRVNRLSGATGLIQWMPDTAKELGTTTEELKNMTAIEQLDYVYKYLKPYKGKLRKISDLYMAVLWPAAVGKKEDYILFENGTAAYKQNKGLDLNEDGFITKEEATQRVIDNRIYHLEENKEDSGQKP